MKSPMIAILKIKGFFFKTCLISIRTDYVRLHFDNHEKAWLAAAKLEVMLAEMSTPFFSFDWIKTSWFYESAKKAKERKRLLSLKEEETSEQNDNSTNVVENLQIKNIGHDI